MNVDIRVQFGAKREAILMPILPESIKVKHGEGQYIEYDIMGKGPVAIPSGVGLTSVSFESEFPGEYRTDLSMLRGTYRKPSYYQSLFNKLKKDKSVIRLIVTGYPINMEVTVAEFETQASGFMGDLAYTIAFQEHREIIITEVNTKKTSTSNTKRNATSEPTYTIKKGDTLWSICVRMYGDGTRYTELYKANKTIIESTAKKNGKSSSNYGWWIYPGTILKIPK